MRKHALGAIGGATISKMAPAAVQLVLLIVVAQAAGVREVGLLSLASATAFLCGALGEFGFALSLAAPKAYLGVPLPPLRATRLLRYCAAAAATALYVVLWLGGIGEYDERLLLVAPLPFALALSYGLAGAMNAQGKLASEGIVTVVEAALIVSSCLLLALLMDPLSAALLSLVAARMLGLGWRVRIVSQSEQGHQVRVARLVRTQLAFVAASVVIVVHGQADFLVLGVLGSVALLGTWGPAVRLAYGALLLSEAASWTFIGRLGDFSDGQHAPRLLRRWREVGLALSLVLALVFTVVATPILRLAFGPDFVPGNEVVLLLAAIIPVRTLSFIHSVAIVRGGAQSRRIPVLLTATIVLVIGASLSGSAGSLTGLAASKLLSELVIVLGYVLLGRRLGNSRGALSHQLEPA